MWIQPQAEAGVELGQCWSQLSDQNAFDAFIENIKRISISQNENERLMRIEIVRKLGMC